MARHAFSFDDTINLALPGEDAQANFAWANLARNAAYTRYRSCILKGYEHQYKNRYKPRPILIKSPWDERGTLRNIRQLVEEMDDLDRFRNYIEGVLIDSMGLAEHLNHRVKLRFRSYNRREEQEKLMTDIQASDLTSILDSDPTVQSTQSWNRQFEALGNHEKFHELCIELRLQDSSTLPAPRPRTKLKSKPKYAQDVRRDAHEEREQKDQLLVLKTPRKRTKINHVSSMPTTIDPVIEQWYTDPYNRYDPDGVVGNKLRKEVLTTALRNRGFRGNRIVNIVNWLVRCNGRHKDYDKLVGSNRRKTGGQIQGRYTKNKHGIGTPKDSNLKQNGSIDLEATSEINKGRGSVADQDRREHSTTELKTYPSPVSINLDQYNENESGVYAVDDNGMAEIEPDDDLFNFTNTDNDDVDPDADIDTNSECYPFTNPAEHAAIIKQIKEEIVGVRPSFHSSHAPGTQGYQDDYDDWRLEDLKRTQSFWNIVYGTDLDDAAEDMNLKFTYFRDPEGVPRPDLQYPSQGLKKLKKCVVNGQDVWTEDETFGLYVPTKRERIVQDGVGNCIKKETEEPKID